MISELIGKLKTDERTEALSMLCALSKTAKARAEIDAKLMDRTLLDALLSDEQPKVRKNVYRLIGALENPKDQGRLTEALKRETTLFTVPSLLLSLGRLRAEEALRAYQVPISTGIETDKHVAEITVALSKALQQFDRTERTTIRTLSEKRKILVYAPRGMVAELRKELIALGLTGEVQGNAILVETDEIGKVYRSNCMVEALLPIQSNVPLEPKAIAAAAHGCIGTNYRIELVGYLKDRAKFIERLKALLDGKNNPSNYDCELRIDCRNERCDLYWKLWNVEDFRYPWRVGTIPASIHPAMASALSSYALSLVKHPHPHVLDPFCGSGSLLFASETARNVGSLLGVDKSGTAIETARQNAKAANSRATFVCRDIQRFEARSGADLVLSNLPFGNRVGSHSDNEQLYRRFVRRLPNLLANEGIAVLYTVEGKLLEQCVRDNPRLALRTKLRTEAGGLSPWVFVVDKVSHP